MNRLPVLAAVRHLVVAAACAALVLGGCRARPTPPPPTASQTPTVEPTQDLSILYRDTFEDAASGWPAVNTGAGRGDYEPPEHYRITVLASDALVAVRRSSAFADYSAEAFLVTPESGQGDARYGMVFRQIGPEHYYALVVSPEGGRWQALKRVGESWHVLAEGVSTSIQTDPQSVNTLRVDAQGSSLTFSVNGKGLATLEDADYAAGDFGFMAETFGRGQMTMGVDELVVRRFDAARVPDAPTVVPATPTPSPTPTATETATPTQTVIRATVAPTVNLQTAIVGTATSVAATISAAATALPALATQVCGFPGFPVCP